MDDEEGVFKKRVKTNYKVHSASRVKLCVEKHDSVDVFFVCTIPLTKWHQTT